MGSKFAHLIIASMIQGLLSDNILTRFDMYAGRVRVLYGASAEIRPTPFACTYLSCLRHPLIPGLRKIRISDLYYDWSVLLLLCSTKLKSVDVFKGGDEDGHKLGAFLHSLRASAGHETHGLEKLRIFPAHHTHVDFITKFDMLQDIVLLFDSGTTGPLLVEDFSKLSALRRLSRLSLTWHVDDAHQSFVSSLLPPPHSVNFLSLHSIEIRVPSYMVLLLVQCLRADNLKRIELKSLSSPLCQPTAPRRIIEECDFVATSLEADFAFHGNLRIGRETFDSILNLTRRFQLRRLAFDGRELEIDDAYINSAYVARCFSHLEILCLTSHRYLPHCAVTLQVLRSLAIHCPLLKDLDLSFTVEEEHLPLLVKEMEKPSLSHPLQSLIIRLKDKPETTQFFANGESILIVSRYLKSLFPSLDLRDIRWTHWIQYDTFIKGIRRTLKELQI